MFGPNSIFDKIRYLIRLKKVLEKCSCQLAKKSDKTLDSIIMLRFGKTKVTKEEFYGAAKPIRIWDINVDNKVISKLIETKIIPSIWLDI